MERIWTNRNNERTCWNWLSWNPLQAGKISWNPLQDYGPVCGDLPMPLKHQSGMYNTELKVIQVSLFVTVIRSPSQTSKEKVKACEPNNQASNQVCTRYRYLQKNNGATQEAPVGTDGSKWLRRWRVVKARARKQEVAVACVCTAERRRTSSCTDRETSCHALTWISIATMCIM